MSFDLDDKNSSNSMIVKDILNEFPFDKSEIKDDQNIPGGIPLSRVIDLEKHEKILPVLKCKICLNILLNPYDCSKCGNTFCYTCINKLKESMKKCPFGCIDYEIMPSSFAIKKFLEQLNFTCLNKDNGCNEIISYNNLEQHDKNCKYINSICPNNQCGKTIQWNLLNNHIQNECLYTLFECPKCHLKINRKEFLTHTKICGIINKEFEKQNPIINKLTSEDLEKNNEIFNNVMNSIENFPSFTNENNNDNKSNNLNNNLNILIKSLIFCFSGRISMLENQMNKINTNLQQYNESNLIFYKSINDELENINEKLKNINLNESSNDNNQKTSISKNNKTYSTDIFEFGSPINQNIKEQRKTIFPQTTKNINLNEKLLLLNTTNKERQNSAKGTDKITSAYQKGFLSNSKNKKKKSKFEFSENNSINNEIKDKNNNNFNNIKKGTTISTLKTKEKFIKGMKSTRYMEKLKGIQPKKSNYIINNYNTEEKSSNDNINNNSNNNTNIINEQSNNYLISNNFNTINGNNYLNTGSNKIENKNYSNIHKNMALREKIFREKDKINNENTFDYIFNTQEIILDKIQNLENVMIKVGNMQKDNNINNEFLSSFNSHKQSFAGINNNSLNVQSESPKSNKLKNQN